MNFKELSRSKCFNGTYLKLSHFSPVLNCDMKVSLFVPAVIKSTLFFLGGLTCNEDNFITKSGCLQQASSAGILIVCPDTSPRSEKVQGDTDNYYFGVAASYYLTATEAKWNNWNMFEYITEELRLALILKFQLDPAKIGISGHSVAFAPVLNPSKCPWGQAAFTGYLGSDEKKWKDWDSTELLKSYKGPKKSSILIDQGSTDQFLAEQLLPGEFVKLNNPLVSLEFTEREGYDHSYWFVASFIGDHLNHHLKIFQ